MTKLNRRQTMALLGAAAATPMAPAILRAQDKPAGPAPMTAIFLPVARRWSPKLF